MSCGKPIKNPCMVCRRTVTPKTGLQCQGSCKAWIHFTCCSYTPGKIKDIKAKLIKVRCPCPHCTPDVPKEEFVNESFSCVNAKCPVNLPRCGTRECPENKMNQMPSAVEWPGISCGASCKRNKSNTNSVTGGNVRDRPSQMSCPPRQGSANSPQCTMRRPPYVQGQGNTSPYSSLPIASPPPPSPPYTPEGYMTHPPSQQPPSPTPPCPLPKPGQVMPSISVVENMCETVGLLSDQLNQLMSKMTHVLNPSQKSKCPKGTEGTSGNSCLCPQNPRRI